MKSHESTRQRAESSQSKINEDHIAGKGFTSMSHYNLVRKFIPMPQEMKISDAKAAVDKEWKKLETIPAWALEIVKSKIDVILEAQRNNKKIHLATLMDICHHTNAELEPKLQKNKGRVVLRGDIVKDDSGSHVFTEQGSSASQMTATWLCKSSSLCSICLYTQVQMEDAPKLLKIPKSECADIWIRHPRHKGPKSWVKH